MKLTRRDKQVFSTGAATLCVISAVAGLVSFYVHNGTGVLLWTSGVLVVVSVGYLAISRTAGRKARVALLPAAAVVLVVVVAAGAIGAVIGYQLRPSSRKTTSSSLACQGSVSQGVPTKPYRAFSDPNTVDVSAVAFSPDSKTLAVADANGGAFLWNIPAASYIEGLHSPKGQSAWDVAYSPEGKTVADVTSNSKTYDKGSVYLWNVASPAKPIATFPDPQGGGFGTIAFSPAGNLIAAADNNGAVYLLDATALKVTGKLQGPAPGSGYGIEGLAFSPDGRELAGAGNNGSIYVWKVATRALADGPFHDPNSQDANGIAFSPDGDEVAVADTNGNAYIWNLASGKVVETFRDPSGLPVVGVAFTPDGCALVATSHRGKDDNESAVRVWNVVTRTVIHTFYDPSGYGAGRLAMSRDGHLLAIADGNAYVWPLDWLRL